MQIVCQISFTVNGKHRLLSIEENRLAHMSQAGPSADENRMAFIDLTVKRYSHRAKKPDESSLLYVSMVILLSAMKTGLSFAAVASFRTSPLASAFVVRPPTNARSCRINYPRLQQNREFLAAKPKRSGSVVDSYQTVSVNCSKCRERLFRYKKKNGTKSGLVKCFIERIAEDSAGVLRDQGTDSLTYQCPSCQTQFARFAVIRGMPALKLVGGKTRMTRK